LFGAAMLSTVWEWWITGLFQRELIDPGFHFTYHGLSWVRPLPPAAMWAALACLGLASVGMIVGLFYRLSTIACFLLFSFFFLLEKALYLNHYYLMALLALAMCFVPAHRWWSVDARLRPSLRSERIGAWALWWLRFQVGLPYVYGGLAKLNGDWLRGAPMNIWLPQTSLRHLLGLMVDELWFALLFSWGGMVFDLAIVPLLMWRRTRIFGFCCATAFHLTNATMLEIGVFPWLMIGATTIFFEPDWPMRLWSGWSRAPESPASPAEPVASAELSRAMSLAVPGWQKVGLVLLAVYLGLHLIVPFRHLLVPGDVNWTEEGDYFSWRMMLRSKKAGVQFIAFDPQHRSARNLDVSSLLTAPQLDRLGSDPEMMRELAQHLGPGLRQTSPGIEVRVIALASLNGRKPQLMIDPRVDLSSQPRRFGHQGWIVPLHEPFRSEPWDVPMHEWHQNVDLSPGTR